MYVGHVADCPPTLTQNRSDREPLRNATPLKTEKQEKTRTVSTGLRHERSYQFVEDLVQALELAFLPAFVAITAAGTEKRRQEERQIGEKRAKAWVGGGRELLVSFWQNRTLTFRKRRAR